MGTMELLHLLLGLVCFHVLLCPLSAVEVHSVVDEGGEDVRRSNFPDDFLFGTATSSYQVEGAFSEDGKGLSNWDIFCHVPGNVNNDDNGDIADNHYHRFMEDVELMHSLGVNAYRFSISWSRILPRGRFGEVNPKGVSFYSNLIDNLLLRGIEPFVTIHHHDIPQELEDRYGAWLSPSIQEDFVHFAKTCFESFGDRVKYWATVNEPNLFLDMAYVRGQYPPKHCSQPFGNCTAGNSDTEPLVAMHNLILSHAKAVRAYRDKYQRKQGGSIGIIISTTMYEPLRDDDIDRKAVQRALAFNVAWALDPLVHGHYPPEMHEHVGGELPEFTQEEEEYVKGSVDFVGVNHYSTLYAKDCIHSACENGGDRPIRGFVNTTGLRDSIPIGDPTGMARFFVVPRGMEKMVNYIRDRYKNVPMYITENGYASLPEQDDQPDNPLLDIKRISYHKAYLASLLKAIKDGADVRGYFIWSLMDNFEWIDGYKVRFGLYYVDRGSLERRPKLSARWYMDFLAASTTAPKARIPVNGHGTNSAPM